MEIEYSVIFWNVLHQTQRERERERFFEKDEKRLYGITNFFINFKDEYDAYFQAQWVRERERERERGRKVESRRVVEEEI